MKPYHDGWVFSILLLIFSQIGKLLSTFLSKFILVLFCLCTLYTSTTYIPMLSNMFHTRNRLELETKSMQAKVNKSISLKLMVDEKNNRVIFAQSNKDFIDVLFSILTLPMGEIVRLADKKSGIGCMDSLYTSLQNLEEIHFQEKFYKTKLLNPRSGHGVYKHRKFYICSNYFCLDLDRFRLANGVKYTTCCCGYMMDYEVYVRYKEDEDGYGDGTFVKDISFMITDNLHVSKASPTTDITHLGNREFEVESDHCKVRECHVDVDELRYLLARSVLSSKTPLTDIFLGRKECLPNVSPSYDNLITMNQARYRNPKQMKVKLVFIESTKEILCIEDNGEFIDFLFSFLTFPIGFIINQLNMKSHMGSMDNLYLSVYELSVENCIKSEECKRILLNPKVSNNFGCKNEFFQIEEDMVVVKPYYNIKCSLCFYWKIDCSHIKSTQSFKIIKPVIVDISGGLLKQERSLVVTDDLSVEEYLPVSGFLNIMNRKVPLNDVKFQVITVGEKEALALWRASLVTKRALTHVFRSILTS